MPAIFHSEQLVLLSHQVWMTTGWRMTPAAWGLFAATAALSLLLAAIVSVRDPGAVADRHR